MPKFLIIDGSSMLSTSYYGNLPKSILFVYIVKGAENKIISEFPLYVE